MDINAPDAISWSTTVSSLAASVVCPLIIGLERYARKKPIDFRPYVIISLVACALIIASQDTLHEGSGAGASFDPTRVIQGVITGIGFLGAGAMFREGDYIKGAGTAASIWSAGAIGLICGLGEIWLAGIVSVVIVTLMIVSGPFTAPWDSNGD